jgi:hypothetical protein
MRAHGAVVGSVERIRIASHGNTGINVIFDGVRALDMSSPFRGQTTALRSFYREV